MKPLLQPKEFFAEVLVVTKQGPWFFLEFSHEVDLGNFNGCKKGFKQTKIFLLKVLKKIVLQK